MTKRTKVERTAKDAAGFETDHRFGPLNDYARQLHIYKLLQEKLRRLLVIRILKNLVVIVTCHKQQTRE